MLSVKPSPISPFTALLTVFFSVVAVIIDQQLFSPIIQFVLQASEHAELSLSYIFNGLLSSIWIRLRGDDLYQRSENGNGKWRYHVEAIRAAAVAINTLPIALRRYAERSGCVPVPADLCTRAIDSPLFWTLVSMALPYTLVLTLVGLLCVEFTLAPVTEWFMQMGWIATL
ncbi:hypothetical protein ACNKHU_07080 [Shigella flexneri]